MPRTRAPRPQTQLQLCSVAIASTQETQRGKAAHSELRGLSEEALAPGERDLKVEAMRHVNSLPATWSPRGTVPVFGRGRIQIRVPGAQSVVCAAGRIQNRFLNLWL